MLRLIAIAALCAVLLMIGVGCAKKSSQTLMPTPNNVASETSEQPTPDEKTTDAVNVPSDEAAAQETPTAATSAKKSTPTATEKTKETPKKQTTPAKPELLPRIVDLGRNTCIPCKQMAPILAGLQTELKGKAIVEVIDLRDDPDAADKYKIRLIPTQIFFNTDGKEISRHEGFMPKADIIAKLKEAGMKE